MSSVTTISGIGILPPQRRSWKSVRGASLRRLAPVLGQDLVHLAGGENVRLSNRQSAVVVAREDFSRLSTVGGMLQGPSACDHAVVGDQHRHARSLEVVPDARGQLRSSIGGIRGNWHGGGVEAGDDVV